MRTTIAKSCLKRSTTPPQDIFAWARSLISDPARYGATERVQAIVFDLLAQTGGAR